MDVGEECSVDDVGESAFECSCPVSSSLLSSGRVRFEGRAGQVGVEGPLPVAGLVGSDRVVFVGEGGDALGEVDAVGDVLAVEALVFEGLEPALDDAVGVRGAVPGEWREGTSPSRSVRTVRDSLWSYGSRSPAWG